VAPWTPEDAAPPPLAREEPAARSEAAAAAPPLEEREEPEAPSAPKPPEAALAWPWPEAGTEARRGLPGKPTPPLDLPLPVLVLVEQATRVPEAERPEVASRLNALLAQMAREGGDRQVADTFHRLLEGGKLQGLVDTEGRSCRAVAVESLLALGFPYALEVRPEDLEHLRTAGRPGRGGPYGPAVPLAVLGMGLAGQTAWELLRHDGPDGLVTVQVGLSLLTAVALWLAPPGTAVYRVGLGLLAAVSGFALVLSLVPGLPAGLWAGLAGLVAAFLAALRKS
jgi:hypothetical protein